MIFERFIRRIRLLTSRRKEPCFLLEELLGFIPSNEELYQLALLHKSSMVKDEKGNILCNERLEFLGDAIWEAVVSDVLYEKFTLAGEGFLTKTRSKIVKRETLNKLAVEMGLDKQMNVSVHFKTHNLNIYGNALEALMGAIYLDKGYSSCKKFFENVVLKKYLDLNKLTKEESNYKSKLVEWAQKERKKLEFRLKSCRKVDCCNNIFCSQVLVSGEVVGEGEGYSKRESEQKAAEEALVFVESESYQIAHADLEEEVNK